MAGVAPAVAHADPHGDDPGHSAARIALPADTAGQAHGVAADTRAHVAYVATSTHLISVDEGTGSTTTFGAALAAAPGSTIDQLAVDSVLGEVFVAVDDGHGAYQIKVLAGPSHSLIATLPMASSVRAMAVDERTHTLVAVGARIAGVGGTATFIDERLNAVRGSASISAAPSSVAIDEQRDIAYVSDEIANTVTLIGLDDTSVNTTIAVGEQPAGVAVDQLSHDVFVTNWAGDSVSVIASSLDPTGGPTTYSVVKTIAVAGHPWGIAVDSATHVVYVAPEIGGSLTLIAGLTGSVTETVPLVAGRLIAAAVDDTTATAFVLARIDPALTVVAPA